MLKSWYRFAHLCPTWVCSSSQPSSGNVVLLKFPPTAQKTMSLMSCCQINRLLALHLTERWKTTWPQRIVTVHKCSQDLVWPSHLTLISQVPQLEIHRNCIIFVFGDHHKNHIRYALIMNYFVYWKHLAQELELMESLIQMPGWKNIFPFFQVSMMSQQMEMWVVGICSDSLE